MATTTQVFTTHVESEIDNSLEYEFRLSRDLMEVNEKEEDGLLFEVPDRKLVEANCKERLIKTWIYREKELIKEALR